MGNMDRKEVVLSDPETLVEKMKKRGRPSKYEKVVKPNLFLIAHWVKDGLTDEQIAKRLKIAYSTLREYVKKHSELSAVLKKSKEIVDYEVEESL